MSSTHLPRVPAPRHRHHRPFGRGWWAMLLPALVLAIASPLAGLAACAFVLIVAGWTR